MKALAAETVMLRSVSFVLLAVTLKDTRRSIVVNVTSADVAETVTIKFVMFASRENKTDYNGLENFLILFLPVVNDMGSIRRENAVLVL